MNSILRRRVKNLQSRLLTRSVVRHPFRRSRAINYATHWRFAPSVLRKRCKSRLRRSRVRSAHLFARRFQFPENSRFAFLLSLYRPSSGLCNRIEEIFTWIEQRVAIKRGRLNSAQEPASNPIFPLHPRKKVSSFRDAKFRNRNRFRHESAIINVASKFRDHEQNSRRY